jgi:hypothetical protein
MSLESNIKKWNVESDSNWQFLESEEIGGCILEDLNDPEHECLEFESNGKYTIESNERVSLIRWCSECKNTERLIWYKEIVEN